jgi:hypothetical protein
LSFDNQSIMPCALRGGNQGAALRTVANPAGSRVDVVISKWLHLNKALTIKSRQMTATKSDSPRASPGLS